jgi:pyruvyltransferase
MFGKYDRSKTFWWSPRNRLGFGFKENVGDYLGPQVIEKVLGKRSISIGSMRRGRLLSIGSVMHFANDGDTIWGTGVNGKIPHEMLKFQSLDVRAVRGPLTRDILQNKGIIVPEIYGDPGILTSLFWPPTVFSKEHEVSYIPHMRELVGEKIHSKANVISPLIKLSAFIEEVQKSEKIITTSLHGLIIAESYGIPAVLLRNTVGETLFKYEDYALGTGRKELSIVESFDDGLKCVVPDVSLEYFQTELLDSFPYDLWI